MQIPLFPQQIHETEIETGPLLYLIIRPLCYIPEASMGLFYFIFILIFENPVEAKKKNQMMGTPDLLSYLKQGEIRQKYMKQCFSRHGIVG